MGHKYTESPKLIGVANCNQALDPADNTGVFSCGCFGRIDPRKLRGRIDAEGRGQTNTLEIVESIGAAITTTTKIVIT